MTIFAVEYFKNENMQAYEFDTIIENGLISIPKQYLNQRLTSVRVILLSDSSKQRKILNNKKFMAMKLKTKTFKFNREEANER